MTLLLLLSCYSLLLFSCCVLFLGVIDGLVILGGELKLLMTLFDEFSKF